MNESVIANQLKECKAVYVSYNIFFYKVTQPCFYITSINKETYIDLKIDDFYFNNEDSGYHVKLNNELNDKRKAVIYGVNTDGSLLILDCYKIAISKTLFNDLDEANKKDHRYFVYRLDDINGTKYSLNNKPEEIKDIFKWVVKDEEEHYYTDSEPALHYFRERIKNYVADTNAFICDEKINLIPDFPFPTFLPIPLYNFFLEKENKGTLEDEEKGVINAIESIFLSFDFDERKEEEDFLSFHFINDATEEEKHYVYEDNDYQIKIVVEKGLFEIDFVNKETFVHLKTDALSTSHHKSYYFNSHIRLLKDDMTTKDFDLDISYDQHEGEVTTENDED